MIKITLYGEKREIEKFSKYRHKNWGEYFVSGGRAKASKPIIKGRARRFKFLKVNEAAPFTLGQPLPYYILF
jgi:hypothetical protein